MSEEELDELEYSLDEDCLDDEPSSNEEPPKKKKGHMLALCIVLTVIICLGGTLYGAWIAFLKADNYVPWHPDYDMVDLDYILEKDFDDIKDEEFDVLYAQTGLTKAGVERCYEYESYASTISSIQEDYFADYDVEHDVFAPYVCTDRITYAGKTSYHEVKHVPIEAGDIILTASTHITGWNMGHCGIALDDKQAAQAMAYGTPTRKGSINSYFMNRTTSMILRYVPEDENDTTAQDAANMANSLIGTEYSAFTGLFTKKNSINKTQCAHLVWYSYYQFGVDLDSDGGWLVTPCDIANSPHLEVMQVFGFDPETLWPN